MIDRRANPRYAVENFSVEVDSVDYELFDISVTSIAFKEAPDWFLESQGLHFKIKFEISDKPYAYNLYGIVTRNEIGVCALVYRPPIAQWADVVESIVKRYGKKGG